MASDLKINESNYVLSLADTIGELQRYALDNIQNFGDLDKILEILDEIYIYLFSLDYRSGLTKDLRHKTDKGRNIIEKICAEISLSIKMNELKKYIYDKLKK